MLIPVSSPMAGKVSGNLKDRLDRAGRRRSLDGTPDSSDKGELYAFFNRRGMYDVADSPYLTREQRDSVPADQQHYISDLIDAIVDSIRWIFLGNLTDPGTIEVSQNMHDKTIVKALMAESKADVATKSISAIPGLQAVMAGAEAMSSVMAAIHSLNPYDLDILPKLPLNLPDIGKMLSGIIKPGWFVPDWYFIYKHTPMSYKMSMGSDGIVILDGLDLSEVSKTVFPRIFKTYGISRSGGITGDPVTGLSVEAYKAFKGAIGLKGNDARKYLTGSRAKIRLTEPQAMMAFLRNANITVWSAIQSKAHYSNMHWGFIANAASPQSLRTMIASFVCQHGVDVGTVTAYSAFISYCVRMAGYHMLGYDHPMVVTPLPGLTENMGFLAMASDLKSDTPGKVKYVAGMELNPVVVKSIPEDAELAKSYMLLAADLISRIPYMHVSDPSAKHGLRRRRVAEGNLVYSSLLGPSDTITFASAPSQLPDQQKPQALRSRAFAALIKGSVYTWGNVKPSENGIAYGQGRIPAIKRSFPKNMQSLRSWNAVLGDDFTLEA